jgi:hypothetical protein
MEKLLIVGGTSQLIVINIIIVLVGHIFVKKVKKYLMPTMNIYLILQKLYFHQLLRIK